jgi:glycosyltransferase involved in cell wall biosynthesis
MPFPRISVIIPAFNEARYLPATLAALQRAAAQVDGGVEIIVADNGSTDETAAIARAHGAAVVPVAPKCIAAVRNGGAAAARGAYLVFNDADNLVSENLLAEIARVLDAGRHAGGGVGNVRMQRLSVGTFLFNMLPLWMAALVTRTSMVTFYCTRAAFDGVGGFDETRKMAEDHDFAQRLRRWARGQGLRYHNLYRGHVVVSTRKYDEHGDFFLVRHPIKLLRAIRQDQSVLDEFWYRPNR